MKFANDRPDSHGLGRHRLTQWPNPVDLGCVGDDAGQALVPSTSSTHRKQLRDVGGGEFVRISCHLHLTEKVVVSSCDDGIMYS